MTVAAFVLGLLFIVNTTAFTLITAVGYSNPNPRNIVRMSLTVAVVNILLDALLFVALY